MHWTQTQLSSMTLLMPWDCTNMWALPHTNLENVLDLILSDITDNTKVLTTTPGPFVTDHRAVIRTLSIKKLKPITRTKLVRQISKVQDDQ